MLVTFFPKYCVIHEIFQVLSFGLVTSFGLRFNSDALVSGARTVTVTLLLLDLTCDLSSPRAPFDGQDEFTEIKSRILDPSIELVINAQRDSFAVRPVDGIREASKQLADVCDSVIKVGTTAGQCVVFIL